MNRSLTYTLRIALAVAFTCFTVSSLATPPPHPADQGVEALDQLLDKPGKGRGIPKKLRSRGSSGGVARGDFNGDGFADLAVGTPLEDVVVRRLNFSLASISNAGTVTIIYGSAPGLAASGTAVPASQRWLQGINGVLDAAEKDDQFGAALAAGDFNGDGRSDLAIGVAGERDAAVTSPGAVQVLYGSATGLTATGNQLFRVAKNLFGGFSLVWADFTGDGFGDLAIESSDRKIVLLPGSSGGLTTVGSQVLSLPNDIGVQDEAGGFLFDLVLAAGDFNNDTRADLAVGAPLGSAGAVQFAGNVRILPGTSTGVTLTGSRLFHQNISAVPEVAERNDHFGAALAVGDFNGDTSLDLAVGVPDEDNGVRFVEGGGVSALNSVVDGGAVNVFFGTGTGLTVLGSGILFEARVLGIEGDPFGDANVEGGDHIGAALAAGDFDDDGLTDLAIGAPGERLGSAAGAGSVAVFYGGSFDVDVGQFWTESSLGGAPATGDSFGATLSAWNFGRNHNVALIGSVQTADLAIGLPRDDVNGKADAGAVRVIYGFTTGLATSVSGYNPGPLTRPQPGPAQLWHQDSDGVPDAAEAGDQFGSALY